MLTLRSSDSLPVKRIYLGKVSGFAGRQYVYRVPGGLEVDDTDYAEIQRRRVFFDDVLLVTRHRFQSWLFVIVAALGFFLFLFLALMVKSLTGSEVAALVFVGMSLLFAVPVGLRLVYRIDAVTVYGNRTKAQMHFWLMKGRARRVFDEICAAVREAQDQVTEASPSLHPPDASSAPPADNPMEASQLERG